MLAGVHRGTVRRRTSDRTSRSGKIVGVETEHVELDESLQVAEYPTATVLPGLIDSHVHLVADSEVGALDRVPGLGDDDLDAVITEGLAVSASGRGDDGFVTWVTCGTRW